MSAKTETAEVVTDETVPANSKKREITAAVASTTVTVVLGLAATALVNNIAGRVRNAIAPQPEKPE